eukprot:scaffold66848_cov46-Prasinocladus_malaysianus.AAC.2
MTVFRVQIIDHSDSTVQCECVSREDVRGTRGCSNNNYLLAVDDRSRTHHVGREGAGSDCGLVCHYQREVCLHPGSAQLAIHT